MMSTLEEILLRPVDSKKEVDSRHTAPIQNRWTRMMPQTIRKELHPAAEKRQQYKGLQGQS